jgi:hypothetical protein
MDATVYHALRLLLVLQNCLGASTRANVIKHFTALIYECS